MLCAPASVGSGVGVSLSGFKLRGSLLAYSSKTCCSSMMSGMLITMVSSATRIVKIGSFGGGAREQVESELSQSQREALARTLDGAEMQDT